MKSFRGKLVKFLLPTLVVILGGALSLYFLNKESRPLQLVSKYPNENPYLVATSTYYNNHNPVTQKGSSLPSNGGIYSNTVYGYEIQYPKGVKVGPVTEGSLVLPTNELVAVRFSLLDHNANLDIFGGLWETMIPMIGMGVNIDTLYSDDLKTFAQKIWKLQGEDFDNKVTESVTELITVPFAGTQAYSFIARTKGVPYIKYAVGNGDTEKNFLIFENLGKKIVVMYTSKDSTIEAIKNSFRFIK